jgi:pyruvate,water dikinase
MPLPRFVRWFNELSLADVPSVGGKNASLGELYRELAPAGIRVSDGFAITADGYRHFLAENKLTGTIRGALAGLDTGDLTQLAARGRRIREAVLAASIPDDLRREILAAYARLCEESRQEVGVGSGPAQPLRTCPGPASPASKSRS